jgi:hypothetical protein
MLAANRSGGAKCGIAWSGQDGESSRFARPAEIPARKRLMNKLSRYLDLLPLRGAGNIERSEGKRLALNQLPCFL